MAEPVGNQPRREPKPESGMAAITGNSHRSKEPGKETSGNREPVEKIVEGVVISRKTPWYTRFARSMVAEDAGTVGDYILINVVIPATKNLIIDMISQTAERVFFGTDRGRLRRSPLGMGLRDQVNYGGISRDREPRRTMTREARARHDFNDIVLESRTEAVEVIEAMADRIGRYAAVTVAELYDLVGVTGSYTDRQWGWTDLITAEVRQVPGGFLLDLPAPEPIR